MVTVGSGELFHLQRVGGNGHHLTKAKLGMNSSSDERKGIPSSQAILKSNGDHVMVTLSQNGAVFPLRLEEIDFGCFSLTSKKLLGYVCLLCLSKHQNCNHLRDHFSSQHVGPVLCDRCGRQQADWLELKEHKLACFFDCGVPGCSLTHTLRSQAVSHHKKFMKANNLKF